MTTGQRIFAETALRTLRDIGLSHLDPAHGAAVETIRWCLTVRGRPTHHRLAFLEAESPALLAYVEALARSGNSASWRKMEERIRFHAEILREGIHPPCARPWLAAIWHTLPEFASIGQSLLDRSREKGGPSPNVAPTVSASEEGSGEADKGSGGKSGASGTSAKPRPSSRLALPVVRVELTTQEKKALNFGEEEAEDASPATADQSTDNDDDAGPKPPGAKR